MSPTPLDTRLRELRRRVGVVLGLCGLSWLVSIVFGGALLAGMLDWLVHVDDPGLRAVFGVAIVAGAGWVAWRFLIAPLTVRLSDVDLAARIERRFPGFKDSLASTVEFAAAGADPAAGSPELQRRTIETTVARMQHMDLSDVVSTRQVRRASTAAIVVCAVVAVVVGFNQTEAAIAFRRLVLPFSAPAWPRQYELRLLDEQFQPLAGGEGSDLKIARGNTLEIFVENVHGRLPDDLEMQYDYGEGRLVTDSTRTTNLRHAAGNAREVGVARLAVSKGPLKFRAVGGDHRDMPWHVLHVVPPPVVEELHVSLTPPAYSGRPVENLPPGVGHIEGLVGTEVSISAAVGKPLQSARLRIKDHPPRRIELSVDGLRFETSFAIEDAGVYSYWFDLRDRQGFENGDAVRYEIRGIADLAPDVFIERPATDMQVTIDAEVPLRIVAKDDLGLSDIRLRYKLAESEGAAEMELLLRRGEPDGERPQQLTVDDIWRLAELPLSEGMQILFHAEALDDYDLGEVHVGRSIARALTVVSRTEKQTELASRQTGLLEELERILQLQQRGRQQLGELLLQWDNVGRLRAEDVDVLKRVELDQRQITSRLLNPIDGIETQAGAVLAEMQGNRVDDEETKDRLERIVDTLGHLRAEHLPAVEQLLTQARKAVQTTSSQSTDEEQDNQGAQPTVPADPSRSLSDAREHQVVIEESLQALVGLLSKWRHRSDLETDLENLISGQEDVADETAQTAARTQGRPSSSLSPQEQADLAKLAERQRRQAEHLSRLRNQLDEVAGQLAELDRSAADALLDAADHVDRKFTAAKMQEAARQLNENRTGQAETLQKQALDELDELRSILRQQGESDAAELVEELRKAEDELEQLHKRQQELQRRADELQKQPQTEERLQQLQKLAEEQEQLRDDLLRLSRRVERLHAQQAGRSMRRSAEGMRNAAEDLRQNDGAEDAAADLQEAEDDLEQARRELAASRREAEEQLARELMEQFADALKGMVARQQQVIDETLRLDAEYQRRGNWSRGQLKSLLNLVEIQRGLKQETDGLVERLAAAEVFALALRGASRQMETAAQRLADRKTDAETIAAETAAQQRFADLIAALQLAENQPDPSQAGNTGGGNSNQPMQDSVALLAELKLMKTLQEDLNRRTLRLDDLQREHGGLTPAQQTEAEQIADEQGQLADLARNLMQRALMPGGAPSGGEEAKPTRDEEL